MTVGTGNNGRDDPLAAQPPATTTQRQPSRRRDSLRVSGKRKNDFENGTSSIHRKSISCSISLQFSQLRTRKQVLRKAYQDVACFPRGKEGQKSNKCHHTLVNCVLATSTVGHKSPASSREGSLAKGEGKSGGLSVRGSTSFIAADTAHHC